VFEPFFRVFVELGYDRNIPPWEEPTPARLIPTTLDPAKVTIELVDAVGEGVTNALALVGLPAPVSPVPSIANPGNTQQVAANEAVVQPSSFDSLQSQPKPNSVAVSMRLQSNRIWWNRPQQRKGIRAGW
jgi:hypothetical protein